MTIPTWKVGEAKMAVCVNGAYVQFRHAPDSMQRFVRPALFSTGDAKFELRYAGSCLMAKYRDWSFALMSNHQVGKKYNQDSDGRFCVVVATEGGRSSLSPTSLYRPKHLDHDLASLDDIALFDYSEGGKSGVRPQHLNLSEVLWSDAPGVRPDYSFLIGYPHYAFTLDLDSRGEEVSEFTARWIRQDLQEAAPALMDTENRNMFVKHEASTRSDIDPEGLSGGPVFSIVGDDQKNRYLRFDGIITNARDNRFAVYPSTDIRRFLDCVIAGL